MMHIEGEQYRKVKVVIPPDAADTAARMDAIAHIRRELKKRYGREITSDDLAPDIVSKELVGDRAAKEMLARVLYAPLIGETLGDTNKTIQPKRLFIDADHVERVMHPDEIAILFAVFTMVRHELGPRPAVLNREPELLQKWINRLKEGAWSLGPLRWLALADLEELCCSALQLLSDLVDSGPLLLTQQYLESLHGLESTQANSDSDSISSGEPAETSTQSTGETLGIDASEPLTVEKAFELAQKLRRR
jgi:hypothetical protein